MRGKEVVRRVRVVGASTEGESRGGIASGSNRADERRLSIDHESESRVHVPLENLVVHNIQGDRGCDWL